MALYEAEAIVLRVRPLGEADGLVTLLTRSEGKTSVAARGIRRPRSRLLGACQPFVWARFQLFRRSSGLDSVSQAHVLEPFRPLREDLRRMALASYAAELVDMALPEADPQPEVFALLLGAFHLFALEEAESGLEAALRKFELRFLALLGYRPRLEACAACGKGGPAPPGQPAAFSASRGGLLCRDCLQREGAGPGGPAMLGAETVAVMRHILQVGLGRLRVVKPSSRALAEMGRILPLWVDEHLGKSPKSRAFLESLGVGTR